MPNEVEIRITADDLTGPAFASAISKMQALKAIADDVGKGRQIDFGIGNELSKLQAIGAEVDNVSRNRQISFGISDELGKLQAINAELADISRSRNLSFGIADALAKMELLKREMDSMSFGRIDTSGMGASLQALRSKIQSLGIADIADVNIQPGRLQQQMQLIKRLVQQAGISDLLDFNVKDSALQEQLAKIGTMTEDIPVNFEIGKMPFIGPATRYTIPVTYDVSKIPQVGDVSNIEAVVRAEEDLKKSLNDVGYAGDTAAFSFKDAADAIARYAALAQQGTDYNAFFGRSFANLFGNAATMGQAFRTLGTNIRDWYTIGGLAFTYYTSKMAVAAGTARGVFFNAMTSAALAVTRLNDNVSLGLPMWTNTSNLWWGLGGKIQLFGGALTHIGIPAFIGAASGLHLLTEGIIETAATLIPAIAGIGAFAASAVDGTNEIYNHFVNMNKAIDYTGQSVYPLTGAFQAMNNAAKPQLYILLGEGLQVVSKNAGVLQYVAHSAGTVIDNLGARFTYAVTQGSGFNMFVRNAASDLSGWGNTIGNLLGIIGNFLKVMPGYAEVLLNVAQNVTHVAEDITGSGIGEGILRIGLAAHGAILYIGLLDTGLAVLVSRTLPLVAASALKVGLAFDRIGMSGAANAMGNFAAGASRAATLPWGWIGLAAAGVAFLAYELVTAKDAAQQFNSNIQNTLNNSSLATLGNTLGSSLAATVQQLNLATRASDNLQHSFDAQSKQGSGRSFYQLYAKQVSGSAEEVSNYTGGLRQLQTEQDQVNAHVAQAAKIFGGTSAAWNALNAAGITSAQLMTSNNQTWGEALIMAKGYQDSLRALTDGTGRYAAAMNALSGPEQYLGDMLKSIQSITQAQDNLMGVVTSSETAFATFGTAQGALAHNFTAAQKAAASVTDTLGKLSTKVSLTGGYIGGTSQASLALSQAFYDQVGNAQKVIDSLEQQEIDTKNLQAATATLAAQMLPYAQNNEAARATIVSMINDALGPGTVSLQNLDGWVKKNSTSLDGLNSIVAESTIKAGTLANVLQSDLNAQFHQALLQSSGADSALQKYTNDLVNNQQKTAIGKADRIALITDLEKTGMSAKDATGYVNGLQTQIDGMKGKNVQLVVTADGAGGIEVAAQGLPSRIFRLSHLSAGGYISGGIPGRDSVLGMLKPGEVVVPTEMVDAGLVDHLRGRIPGFSGGGIVGMEPWVAGQEASDTGYWAGNDISSMLNSMISGYKSSVGGSGGYAGPGGGSAGANVALAQRILGWTGGQFADLVNLWTRESGWNQYAYNASSGATGIPQALPYTKMPQDAWLPSQGGSANVMAQETWGNSYIIGRYGNPSNAWAHELQYGWYDHGGWLKPGWTMAYNGTGSSEPVGHPGGDFHITLELGSSFKAAGLTEEQLNDIRYTVRTRGGGNVQKAFGKV
jgi:hypothetical protein